MAHLEQPVAKRQKVYHGNRFSGQSKVHAGDVYGNVTNNETRNYYSSARQNTVDRPMPNVRQALFITDPVIDRSAIVTAKGSRAPRTCEWILRDPKYVSWTDGGHSLLWISGGPGKGKTMMSVFLTQHLEQQSCANGKNVVYYFCNSHNDTRNTATSVLRALLWQLCGLYPELERECFNDFDSPTRAKYTISSVDALWGILLRVIKKLPKETLCVLDGLDECDQESIRFLASNLTTSFASPLERPNTFRIAIVSRDIHALKQCARIKLDPDNNSNISRDIAIFVSARMRRFSGPPGFSEEMRRSIYEALMQRAEGTFLWVGFAVHELEQKTTCTEVLDTVHMLPKGLPAIYGRVLLLIEERHRELSLLIIQWVLMATRPLILEELAAAVGVTPNQHLNLSQVMQDHIHHCGPLLRVDQTSLKVSLVHQSAYDYFTGTDIATDSRLEQFRVIPGDAHARIADTCINCIDGKFLRHQPPGQQGKLCLVPVAYPYSPSQQGLLWYAQSQWPEHARAASSFSKAMFTTSPFFKAGSTAFRDWAMRCSNISSIEDNCLLHTACYLGVQSWAEVLLEGSNAEQVNQVGKSGCTPLVRAIEGGHPEMVHFLIRHGANVNQITAHGQSPLDFAIETWRLEFGARKGEVEAWDDENAVVLMRKGAKFHRPPAKAAYILRDAIEFGKNSIARLMVQADANLIIDEWGTKLHALHFAVKIGNIPVSVALLESGVNAHQIDNDGDTALVIAARHGHDHILEILIAWEPGVRPAEEYTRGLQQGVLLPKNDEVVVRLLQSGADAKSADEHGFTPLHRAAVFKHNEATVKLLLEFGADVNATTQAFNRTPLEEAMRVDANQEIVQLLLDHGSSLHSFSSLGYSLLHIAAIRNDGGRVCSALLRHGANVRACDKAGRTPLHYAVMFGQARTTEALLEFGADCNVPDCEGNTPLHFANASLLFIYENTETSPVGVFKVDRLSGAIPCGLPDQTIFIDLFHERSTSLSAVLFEHGANESPRNNAGETPHDLFETYWRHGALRHNFKHTFSGLPLFVAQYFSFEPFGYDFRDRFLNTDPMDALRLWD